MDRAFVKEREEQWLHDVQTSIDALISYLTKENNNITIYEWNSYRDSLTEKEVYEMSNGLSYTLDKNNKWVVIGSL